LLPFIKGLSLTSINVTFVANLPSPVERGQVGNSEGLSYGMQIFVLLRIHMQDMHLNLLSTYKTIGLVVGSPAFQLSSNNANTPSTKAGGELVLKNRIELIKIKYRPFLNFSQRRRAY
jgi:hypothetical protein